MYSEKYALYFIDECHEKNYEILFKKFPQAQTSSEYECAIYVVSLPEIVNSHDISSEILVKFSNSSRFRYILYP
jgi:hypothetical protein